MSERRLGRVAGLVSLATLLSRVLGLVREQVFAASCTRAGAPPPIAWRPGSSAT